MSYRVTGRDYLTRAREQLAVSKEENLFYAAFELRAGVESRLSEYIEDQRHVSEKLKKGWQIAVLARGVERAFQDGSNYARFAYCDETGHEELFVLYYTPISKTLQKDAQRLGDYLHHQRRYRPDDNDWWKQFKNLLRRAETLLAQACTGTMIGPPLMKKGTKTVDMRVELPPNCGYEELISDMQAGRRFMAKIAYSKKFPDTFEENAVIWRHGV